MRLRGFTLLSSNASKIVLLDRNLFSDLLKEKIVVADVFQKLCFKTMAPIFTTVTVPTLSVALEFPSVDCHVCFSDFYLVLRQSFSTSDCLPGARSQ